MPIPVYTRLERLLAAAVEDMTVAKGYARDWTLYVPTFGGEGGGTGHVSNTSGLCVLVYLGPADPDNPIEHRGRTDHHQVLVALQMYVIGKPEDRLGETVESARSDGVRAIQGADLTSLGEAYAGRPEFVAIGSELEGTQLSIDLIFSVPYATTAGRPDLAPRESAG